MIIQVQSMTHKDKTYEVDTIKLTCSCPGFEFRHRRGSGLCKHITKALNDLEKTMKPEDMISFIRTDNNPVSFIDKFGENALNYLKTTGEIYEAHGKLIILE